MGLNRQSGDMYGFVTHTWNPIRGRCEHDCTYCYIKKMYNGKLFEKSCRLVESELKTDLGEGNFIFLGSSTDMFGNWVEVGWIDSVLKYCQMFENHYLFQSKNPKNMTYYSYDFPDKSTLATTIETNRNNKLSKAPNVEERAEGLKELGDYGFQTMVTIEPIIDFDLGDMLELIGIANPDIVTIGADSKRCGLPEPRKGKIKKLIRKLEKYGEIKIKNNLRRIIGK